MTRWLFALCLVGLPLGGCDDDDDRPDASAPDAIVGRADAPGHDAGLDDAGSADAGSDDTGTSDSGVDGSSPDTNPSIDAGSDVVDIDAGALRLPPVNGRLDYQLGGDYPPRAGVTVLSRDREGTPAPGIYTLCYINGYQVQPGEVDGWDEDLVLRDGEGQPIIDPDWDEAILDVSSDEKRARIAVVVGDWIEECATDGFDAIEIDNLDTYSRSDGRISQDDAVDFMVLLSARAHRHGLAIAQKNSAEILGRRAEMGTDFVVVEECSRYDECGDFTDVYGDYVLMIEYRMRDFSQGCGDFGATHAIVLRDVQLVTPERGTYVYDDC